MRLQVASLAVWIAALGCSSSESASPASGAGGNTAAGSSSTAGSGNPQSGSSNGSSGNDSGGSAHGGNTSSGGGAGGSQVAGSSPGGSPSGGTAQGGGAAGPVECRKAGDGKSTISFINQCPGTLSFRGSKIEGGELKQGEHACRDVGDVATEIPAIRFWGFIGEDPGGERYTLAELTLNTSFNDFDWYNISHVDASNLPMSVTAVDMPKCRTLSCPNSLLPDCPAIGLVKDSKGNVISCYSPMRDDKNSVVAQYFEMSCKDAYSWSGDDQESVVACAGEDYDVTFCP